MVKVLGSAGKVVEIQVLGIGEIIKRLQQANQTIKDTMDLGVVRAGGYVEEELKESIMGHRAPSPRSVRTGLFANSIEFFKIRDYEGVVKSNPTPYPENPNVTTEDVAGFLEEDRMHFGTTRDRTANRVQEIIKEEIERGVQKF